MAARIERDDCWFDGCGRMRYRFKNGGRSRWCIGHLAQRREHREMKPLRDDGRGKKLPGRLCAVRGCRRKRYPKPRGAWKYCSAHRSRLTAYGELFEDVPVGKANGYQLQLGTLTQRRSANVLLCTGCGETFPHKTAFERHQYGLDGCLRRSS